MGTGTQLVNAWMLLNEDEPSGTTYSDWNSCYQSLIANNVYQYVDVLYLCFVTTLPTSATTVPAGDGSSYTIQMGESAHAGGLTNQDYMNSVIRDARASNPGIRIAVTLEYGGEGDQLSRIFSNTSVTPQQNAESFAANLMAYLQSYGLNGFDIDWESPLCNTTTQEQFALVIDAIGKEFRQPVPVYMLTLSPAAAGNLDSAAVNQNVDFLNLQLYSGFTFPSDFPGVNPALFAYGAKFEADSGATQQGQQTAQQAYQDNQASYQYGIFTNWRLNSSNYVFEQTQQILLHQLVRGGGGPAPRPEASETGGGRAFGVNVAQASRTVIPREGPAGYRPVLNLWRRLRNLLATRR